MKKDNKGKQRWSQDHFFFFTKGQSIDSFHIIYRSCTKSALLNYASANILKTQLLKCLVNSHFFISSQPRTEAADQKK